MRKIAVTGDLASGKSTVCKILKEKFNACVCDADQIVHQLLTPSSSEGKQILNLLGPSIITDTSFDKKVIANIIFNSPEKRASVEKILHKKVYEEIQKAYEAAEQSGTCSIFVAEVPLLFESRGEKEFDVVICVKSPFAMKLFSQREPKATREHYEKRHTAQLHTNKKAEQSDFVIENNSTIEVLESKLATLMEKI